VPNSNAGRETAKAFRSTQIPEWLDLPRPLRDLGGASALADTHQGPKVRDAARVVLMELDDRLADIDSMATR
jgi:hypothetical protein